MTELIHSTTPGTVDADPAGTSYPAVPDRDQVPVEELTRAEQRFLKPSERKAGVVSRTVLAQRIHAAEGEVLAQLRRSGESVAVRARPDRRGVVFTETASTIGADELSTRRGAR